MLTWKSALLLGLAASAVGRSARAEEEPCVEASFSVGLVHPVDEPRYPSVPGRSLQGVLLFRPLPHYAVGSETIQSFYSFHGDVLGSTRFYGHASNSYYSLVNRGYFLLRGPFVPYAEGSLGAVFSGGGKGSSLAFAGGLGADVMVRRWLRLGLSTSALFVLPSQAGSADDVVTTTLPSAPDPPSLSVSLRVGATVFGP